MKSSSVLSIGLFSLGAVSSHAFTLQVSFTMGPHVGQAFHARVVEQGSNTEIKRMSVAAIAAGGGIAFDFGDILEAGKSYNLDYYADHNENGMYDAPPADHAWRTPIENVSDHVTLTILHNTDFTDIQFPAEPASILLASGNRLGAAGPVEAYDLRGRVLEERTGKGTRMLRIHRLRPTRSAD